MPMTPLCPNAPPMGPSGSLLTPNPYATSWWPLFLLPSRCLVTCIWCPKPDSSVQQAGLRQPRGQRRFQVVPEFKCVIQEHVSLFPRLNDKRRLMAPAPAGAKLLSYVIRTGEGRDSSSCSYVCSFGCYHTKAEFLELAQQVPHPFEVALPLGDASKRVLFTLAREGA